MGSLSDREVTCSPTDMQQGIECCVLQSSGDPAGPVLPVCLYAYMPICLYAYKARYLKTHSFIYSFLLFPRLENFPHLYNLSKINAQSSVHLMKTYEITHISFCIIRIR